MQRWVACEPLYVGFSVYKVNDKHVKSFIFSELSCFYHKRLHTIPYLRFLFLLAVSKCNHHETNSPCYLCSTFYCELVIFLSLSSIMFLTLTIFPDSLFSLFNSSLRLLSIFKIYVGDCSLWRKSEYDTLNKRSYSISLLMHYNEHL